MNLAIEIRDLTKRFGERTAVDGVSLSLERGRICGFLGPNGSGKTTTLRIICGLLNADSGSGQVLGLNLSTDRLKIKRRIGYMTQRFGLFEDLTVRENLDLVAALYDVPRARARIDDLIERMRLSEHRETLAGALSGGWKQRLALAACVLHEPEILVLDEPTAGVDPQARREFWDEIHGLARLGVTVLVSTHYMDEAERCHDIAYIAHGRLLARGSADDIIASSGLYAMTATGGDADKLVERMTGLEGVAMAAAFGRTLHICGPDLDALQRAAAPWRGRPDMVWSVSAPTLEDVFIYLTRRTDQEVRRD